MSKMVQSEESNRYKWILYRFYIDELEKDGMGSRGWDDHVMRSEAEFLRFWLQVLGLGRVR